MVAALEGQGGLKFPSCDFLARGEGRSSPLVNNGDVIGVVPLLPEFGLLEEQRDCIGVKTPFIND